MNPNSLRADCIDTAHRIGRRLCEAALWSGSSCSWLVRDSREGEPSSAERPATGFIYNGTSGISLFLAELSTQTGDAEVKRTAEGALRHAINFAESVEPFAPGFYAGWSGIVLAAARCAHLWSSEEFATAAQELFADLSLTEVPDCPADLISGPSGAIVALLCAKDYVDFDCIDEVLSSLGERLVSTAFRRPSGWSWPTIRVPQADDLVGYAHGTAGIAHALRELSVAMGAGRYALAADEAARYGRRYFDADTRGWHDLRYLDERAVHMPRPRGSAVPVGRQSRVGRIPRFSESWCHGLAGIGLSQLREFSVTSDATIAQDIRVALSYPRKWERVGGCNACLCHGAMGNAEFLAEASLLLGEPAWRERAERRALDGRERFELRDLAWPTTESGERDLTLLTGEAGIGYFYLRMADWAVPSMLALRSSNFVARSMPVDGYISLRNENIEGMFRESLDLFTASIDGRLAVLDGIQQAAQVRSLHDAAADIFEDLRSRRCEAVTAEQLVALRRDRARAELLDLPVDTFNEGTGAEPVPDRVDVPWDSVKVLMTPETRIIDCAIPKASDVALSCENELLVRRGRMVRSLPLSPFAAIVFRACAERPATLNEIIEVLSDLTAPSPEAEPHIRTAVQRLLASAWHSKIVELWRED